MPFPGSRPPRRPKGCAQRENVGACDNSFLVPPAANLCPFLSQEKALQGKPALGMQPAHLLGFLALCYQSAP